MNKAYKRFFMTMAALALVSAMTSLAAPFLLSFWARTDVEMNLKRVFLIISVLVLMLLLKIAIIFLRENFAKHFNIKNAKNIIEKILKLKYDAIISQGNMNLIERMAQAVNNMYIYMTGDAVQIWSSIITTIIILIAIFFDNYIIGLILLALIPINYLGYKALNAELKKRSQVMQTCTATGFQEILSAVNQTDYLKQCPDYDILLNQLKPSLNKIYGSMAQVNKYAQTSSSFISSLNSMLQTVCILLVMYNYLSGENQILPIVIYTIVLPLFFSNVSIITNINLNKNNLKVSQDFIAFLDSEKEKNSGEKIKSIETIEFDINEIRIGEQTFKTNINDKFMKGDIVWVQGKSGSGKSSLMKQLVKFRESAGISINDKSISSISNSCLRSLIDYIPQNNSIINGTIRDNLFLNKKHSIEKEEKLKESVLLSTILQNKNFDTMIMDMGANLSGGEKQKLAIARSLYSDAEVLIFDEVTANIDSESTALILNTIKSTCKNKIVFIISHEALPENYADKIIRIS
ncbi:ABC transporter ATP-binding protein [Treponema sp. OMZ 799]|uniref:ATP-binding cassette domain-containing protein n=1 Tax=Treponema sp. OMZ 799 TaxID=2563668 RepID=UPI0020A30EBE|nr:ABC transporter ATP-binding protein [Treponema sp. OMZ 799]UTC76838.1 ABC transporter ATP-binding protein [Treponema sp. OMZ 799]